MRTALPSRLAPALALALLAGCTTSMPPAQVTRFHLGQPIARGEITVEPRDPALANSLEFRDTAGAVSAELARQGFRLAPGVARAELVAVVDLVRGTRADLAARSPVSVGIGGGSFGGGVGLGGGISFPIGKPQSRDVVLSELSVQLKRRSEGTVVWEGRARTEARAGTPAADPAGTARRLAAALFDDFPGVSGRTVNVK